MYEHYQMWLWISTGVTLVALEIIMGFPLILFIAGLAALTTAVALWIWGELNSSFLYQVIIFLVSIPAWAVLLWQPLKNLLDKRKSKHGYSNIVGQTGIVYAKDIDKGKTGQIKWSGTIVKALLSGESIRDKITVDEEVLIVEVKENIFIVKSIN